MSVRFTYDKEADAVYLGLRDIPDGGVFETVEIVGDPAPVEEHVYADFDSEGRLLGLEFLSLEAFLKAADIAHGGLVPEELIATSLQKL
jgi:uncharacterized protein YuzE